MPDQSLSFRAGKAWAALSIKARFGLIAAVVLAALGVKAYNDFEAESEKKKALAASALQRDRTKAAAIADEKSLTDRCQTNVDDLVKKAKSALSSGDPELAQAAFEGCGDRLIAPEAVALRQKSAQLAVAKHEKAMQAIELAEKARKKKEGVHIGMSREDVRASNWGKPQSINTTTTLHSTREQWVYGGGGYLYFVDGVLTTIQN